MEPPAVGPIGAAVDVLGDRWTLLILHDMIVNDHRHFRALLTGSADGIASNILSDRLVKLLDAGLITRGTAMRGQRARYSLTEAGIRTLPVILALGNWGLDWRDGSPELRVGQQLMRDAGPDFVEQLMGELRMLHLRVEDGPREGPGAREQLAAAYAAGVTARSE